MLAFQIKLHFLVDTGQSVGEGPDAVLEVHMLYRTQTTEKLDILCFAF
jgi:hypothetical protein